MVGLGTQHMQTVEAQPRRTRGGTVRRDSEVCADAGERRDLLPTSAGTARVNENRPRHRTLLWDLTVTRIVRPRPVSRLSGPAKSTRGLGVNVALWPLTVWPVVLTRSR